MLTTDFETAISGHDQSLGVPHVSPRQVGAIELPLPNLEEQSRIAAEIRVRLDAIDATTAAINAELEAIEALPATLLRRAFDDLVA